MNEHGFTQDILKIKNVLEKWRGKRVVLLAYLYGSYASGSFHDKSDIDLALYLNVHNENEDVEVIDSILMAADKDVEILRLDDEDESPFIIQEALKGMSLIEPDKETLYKVSDRVLHEAEGIRYKRLTRYEADRYE